MCAWCGLWCGLWCGCCVAQSVKPSLSSLPVLVLGSDDGRFSLRVASNYKTNMVVSVANLAERRREVQAGVSLPKVARHALLQSVLGLKNHVLCEEELDSAFGECTPPPNFRRGRPPPPLPFLGR